MNPYYQPNRVPNNQSTNQQSNQPAKPVTYGSVQQPANHFQPSTNPFQQPTTNPHQQARYQLSAVSSIGNQLLNTGSVNQSVDQSSHRSANQHVNQHQPFNQSVPISSNSSFNQSFGSSINQNVNRSIDASTACSTLLSRLSEWLDVLLDICALSPALRRWSVSDLQTALQWADAVQALWIAMNPVPGSSDALSDKVKARWEQLKGRLNANVRSRLTIDCLTDAKRFIINQLMQHPYVNPALMQVVLSAWVTMHQSIDQPNKQSNGKPNWRRESAETLGPLIYLTARCNQAINQSTSQYGSLTIAKSTARITKQKTRQELARLLKSNKPKRSTNQSSTNQSSTNQSIPPSLQVLIDMAHASDECVESICWCLMLNDKPPNHPSTTPAITQMTDRQLVEFYQSIDISNQSINQLMYQVLRSFEPGLFDRVRPSTLALLSVFDVNRSINQSINEPLTINKPNLKGTFFARFLDLLTSKLNQSINELVQATISDDVPMIVDRPISRKDSDAFELDIGDDTTINQSINQSSLPPITHTPVSVVLYVGRVFDCFRDLMCGGSHVYQIESVMLRHSAVSVLRERCSSGLQTARIQGRECYDVESSQSACWDAIWDVFQQALAQCT